MLLAVAAPLSVNTLWSVTPSPTTPESGDQDAIVGAAAVVAPIVGSTAPDAPLTLPAASVAVAVNAWTPVDREDVVTLQLPLELVTPVPTTVVPS